MPRCTPASTARRNALAVLAIVGVIIVLLGRPAQAQGTAGAVILRLGDKFQQVVDSHPAGTTYLVAAGIHREQQVVAKDGDTFIGEPGAILSGARDLTGANWQRAAHGWYVDGQSQEGFVHGTLLPGGNPRDAHPEELFVGGQRLQHVASLSSLTPGSWFFDYAADRIYLGEDPAGLGLIETSTTSGAFGGNAVRRVTIDSLTIRHYATPAQHGAVGFFGQHNTYSWTVRNSTIVDNHGAGVRLAPGMTIESSEIAYNGQVGLGGSGEHVEDGTVLFAAPVTIRDNNIHHNLLLDYDWGWEGGAMKIKWTSAGSLVEGNWVHHNAGPGIWYDIDNTDAVIRGNLVEDNDQAGIFYEISYGNTLIEGNHVRRNGLAGVGDEGAGIDISNSRDVTVTQNLVEGNRRGILIRDDNRAPGLHNVVVDGNNILLSVDGWSMKSRTVSPGQAHFINNRYFGTDNSAYRIDDTALTVGGWLQAGIAANEEVFPTTMFPQPPPTPGQTPAHAEQQAGSPPPGHFVRG